MGDRKSLNDGNKFAIVIQVVVLFFASSKILILCLSLIRIAIEYIVIINYSRTTSVSTAKSILVVDVFY
jgi:hypothetical protein